MFIFRLQQSSTNLIIDYALFAKRANTFFSSQFGYHTGKGEHDNSFREEKRLPDGTVTGAYGYVDKDGRKHVVKYTAGKDGFKGKFQRFRSFDYQPYC